jgi:Fe-S cluster biogenesis protein NfuA
MIQIIPPFSAICYLKEREMNKEVVMVDRTKVEEVINRIRPALQRDRGDVELVEITPYDVVKVRLKGACGTCPMSLMTLKGGIEAEMKKAVPGVKAVEAV